jgi:uncharacterized protein YuzE
MRDDTPLRLGPYVFTQHSYDESSDVLYLSIGSPREAIVWESPEGHLVRLDPVTREVVGLTILHAHEQAAGEQIPVTFPDRLETSLAL